VKNKDDHCLLWTLRDALLPAIKDIQRPTKYPVEDGLDITNIDPPIPIFRIKKSSTSSNIWNMGLSFIIWTNGPSTSVGSTFCWSERINWLLCDQSAHCERKYLYERCLINVNKLDSSGIGMTALQNHQRKPPTLFVIYADFEAQTTKIWPRTRAFARVNIFDHELPAVKSSGGSKGGISRTGPPPLRTPPLYLVGILHL